MVKPILYQLEAAIPYRMAIVARPRGGDWLADEIRGLAIEGIEVLVSMLTEAEAQELGLANESKECEAASIRFVNIPVSDRSVPVDKAQFLRCVDDVAAAVRKGKFVAVHCRACIGRSSLLAASVLVRLGWRAGDAFEAVQTARGCPVPDTYEQRGWVIDNVPVMSLDALESFPSAGPA